MSLYHENFVWPLDMPGLKKLVLCYVAREARLKSSEVSLTIREIAFRCGMSDSAVRTYLKELEQASLLTRLPGPGKTVVYRVNLGEAACSA
ncbi:MarR family transcriptional regulator [Paraburkholderia silvatlantica]|uniref:DNA-binding MarR family transcriptional regulator n=1 Tax=Paraburkholderia silvatlantica TaxID=321895 RepID=A0ABR6FLR3_9BURK|nr:helix-turn-helix domain-containing protein [Paraburkholderia silvatlantica]MBB2928366.1 DNA-binding MarR family transcriptional regulator [Paraburkholderia silvatlantica]PVY34589.1 MarR family protein [Paraburkholderia silvatlantica]PXW38804.1 MarR family protein [Paraburkholderia silvatlantica]